VDQLPQRVFVGSEGVRGVESEQPPPAQLAAPLFIERRVVQKRRAATDAVIFGRQRFGRAQARRANRNSRYVVEGFAAYAALAGEDEVE
jgi:hypothetical protein